MTIQTALSPAQVEALLLQLTVPDTEAVRNATQQLKKVLSKLSCVPSLLCILATSQNPVARQLSAVYLRKKIGQHWVRLAVTEKQQAQNMLLECLVNDSERPVKNAIAGVITVVAKYTLSSGGWPHLLMFLESLSKNADLVLREMAIRVFRILLSTLGKTMRAHLGVLRVIFHQGLEDAALSVRVEALKALSTMTSFLDDPASMGWFQSVLEPMLGALGACVLAPGESDVAILALEVLEELADDQQAISQDKLAPILSSILTIAANPNVEMDIRERSAVMISSVIDHRAAAILESPVLIDNLINASMTILLESCDSTPDAEGEPEDDDEDEDEFSGNCRGLAVQILDQCVLNLPDAVVYPRVMSAVSAMMCQAGGPASRRAALFALMVSVEGAANSMKNDFQSILSIVIQGLSDSDPVVREAACLAIGQLSDHLTESMAQHHVHVMEAIVNCMQHPASTLKVKRKLCLAIEALCTELDSGSCVEYVPVLMQRLFQLMQQHSSDLSVLEASINAVAAVAKNAETAFTPFFEQTVTFLHSAMSSADENHSSLKAAAMQCAGAVLLATGETSPCMPLMQLSMETFQSVNDPALREGAFQFWSQVCQLLQADFAPYIESIVHHAMEIIDSEDGMNFRSTKADLNAEFGGGSESSDEDDAEDVEIAEEGTNGTDDCDNDSEDGEGNMRCSILSGFLDEKVAAVDCLTSIARCTGVHAIKFYEPIIECFELLAEYPHENVRLVAMKGLHDMVQQSRNLWPSQVVDNISAESQSYVDRVLPILITLITDDESRDVVASSMDAILSIVLKYRTECIPVFKEHLEDLAAMVKQVLSLETEADKYPIADTEKDSVLDSTCDLIGGMALSFRSAFFPVLSNLIPTIMSRFQSGDQLTQALLLGAIGECVEALMSDVAPLLGHILPLAMQSVAADHARLRRNAAFCAGACFTIAQLDNSTAMQYLNHLVNICHHVSNVTSNDNNVLAAADNVCSALCKLITGPSNAGLSYDVDAMFKTILMMCPLKNDMDECKFVYPTLTSLWASLSVPSSVALPTVQVLGTVIGNVGISAELKASLAPSLQMIVKAHTSEIDLSTLSSDLVSLVQQALHH